MRVVNVHGDFILTPLFDIMADGLSAMNALGNGVEITPMIDYHIQSMFLKMTGAQEQKMKCICWDLASNDYKYRYDYLNFKSYGEHSEYKVKAAIYNDLIEVISRSIKVFTVANIWDEIVLSDEEKNKARIRWENETESIITKAIKKEEKEEGSLDDEHKSQIRAKIETDRLNDDSLYLQETDSRKAIVVNKLMERFKSITRSSCYYSLFQRQFEGFMSKQEELKNVKTLCDNKNLLPSHLGKIYTEEVLGHRNRCAHNLMSYQMNLPGLNALASKTDADDNYFIRFWLIVLIDEIFMRLYKYYIDNAEYV